MQLVFLSSRLPLTKTIAVVNGELSVAPYPHVTKVTSHIENAKTLDEMCLALQKHAALNHCLFNGQLVKPLIAESRRSMTAKDTKKDWIVFDFDKVDASGAEEAIIKYLPAYCRGVSYIVQKSASMFRTDNRQFSGHIFMMLAKPMTEAEQVRWFEHVNFTIPALRESISLSPSGLALHWPLDRTAAYDSKLIYIAPPKCFGFTPAIRAGDAIKCIRKKGQDLAIPSYGAVEKSSIDAKTNELRLKAGMVSRAFDTKRFGDEEVLIDAEPGVIQDVRSMGDHYIKFNLNGGDSLGYWIDLRNPHLLRNFKGEPSLKTAEVDEKFFKTLCAVAPKVVSRPPPDDGTEVLAFYATNYSAQIKTGVFSPVTRRIRLDNSSEAAANSWLMSYGVLKKGPLVHHDIIFDPQSDLQYMPIQNSAINMFRATDYMMQGKSKAEASTIYEIPPIVKMTIKSMLGDANEELMTHFVNWLAYIFQTRKQTGTAWVTHGIEGTGKGSFVKYILSPLFGEEVVKVVQYPLIEARFNDFLDGAMFVVVEEASIAAVDNKESVMAKMRLWITDSPIMMEGKNKTATTRPNYANFIITANKRDPTEVSESNRRFNFGERKETKVVYTPNQHIALKSGAELRDFADMLHRWPVDEEMVRTIVKTEAGQTVHENTTDIGSLIGERVRAGDLQFFIDRTPSEAESNSDFHNRFNPIGMYTALIAAISRGEKDIVTYDDLFILFRMLIPDARYFQDSKTWRLRYFRKIGLETKTLYNAALGASERGIKIEWVVPADIAAQAKKKAKNGLKLVKNEKPIDK